MVNIGCKHTGKSQSFLDTENGIFWQSLPQIEGDALVIQDGLLRAHAASKKEPVLDVVTEQ